MNGHRGTRLANTTNLSFAGVDGAELMKRMPEIAVSSSSACTSALLQPSYVLGALGCDEARARGSVRFSLGRFNTATEIDTAIARVVEVGPSATAVTTTPSRRQHLQEESATMSSEPAATPRAMQHDPTATMPLSVLGFRGAVGGVLMGLANLVPGISGGTMLLAVGVYPGFITAIAEVTTLKLRPRPVVLLTAVAGTMVLSILLCAGLMRTLVIEQRWVMYSLFIGFTLGGVPLVLKLVGRVTPRCSHRRRPRLRRHGGDEPRPR